MLHIGISAARAGAKLLLRSMEHLEAVDLKVESRALFTAELQKMATEEMMAVIHKAHPSQAVITEDDPSLGLSGEACWLIDGISGEDNFKHSYPHCAISLAVKQQNKIIIGLVYDFIRDELFVASRGEGARLNDRRLRVSQIHKLNDALLGGDTQSNATSKSKIRYSGCLALDLAYIAAARLEGCYQAKHSEVESAAGLLLVTEAGGMVAPSDEGSLLAANPKIFKELLAKNP